MNSRLPLWWLAGMLAWSGCGSVAGRRAMGRYGLDSVSAACVRNPASCATYSGRTVATGAGVAVLTGTTMAVGLKVLSEREYASIKQAMEECADQARTDILLQHGGAFASPLPTPAECKSLTRDVQGRSVTWAIRLGLEMHEAALKCAQVKLEGLRPGGFSLQPRYRFNRKTKEKQLIGPEEKAALLRKGGAELKGTLEPDVVLHSGDPLQTQGVLDFKFRCVKFDETPIWRKYPAGHLYEGSSQGEVYEEAFGRPVDLIGPRSGVFR